MSDLAASAGRRFARLAARAVVAWPALWRLFRGPLRAQFDALAPAWDGILGPSPGALAAALERLDASPARVLDVGTGTGKAARLVERFPQAEVLGVDLAPAMVEQACRCFRPAPARVLRGRRRRGAFPCGARRSTSSS